MAEKILIYGGSGGIGSALARRLSQAGYSLHLVARRQAPLAALATELQASYTCGDVLEPALFEQAVTEAGSPLCGLVYAVGTIQLKSLQRLTAEDFLYDYRVNALGAALAIKAALPALKATQGQASILLFSSIAVTQGFAFHASVGMAKGAVEALTRSLASELAPKIRVNALAPSLTRTPLAAGVLKNEQSAHQIAALHPLPRLGEPEEIAALAAFLLGAEAGWITGQVIAIDGGRSRLRPKG